MRNGRVIIILQTKIKYKINIKTIIVMYNSERDGTHSDPRHADLRDSL